ncbi:MAG: CrcB family protein [Thermoleophilia bacterium]
MTPLTWALTIPAGAAGAFARYEAGRLMGTRFGVHAPWGVLAINLVGAFLLGLLVGASPSGVAVIALGTGFLGSFTTFSTWMVETDRVAMAGRWNTALMNIVVPVLSGLAFVAVGFAAGSALS